jgi:hypothetical protein
MCCGILPFDGGPPIYQRKLCIGGDVMGRIQRTWQLFKTASSERVSAHIGIGIKGVIFSFGDSPKSFKFKCKMGSPLITFVLPTRDMLTIRHPHLERQRSNVKRMFFN